MQRQLSIAPSSNLSEAFYDDETLELTVVFKGGATYVVSNVPTTLPEEFESAASSGKFYNQNIRGLYVIVRI